VDGPVGRALGQASHRSLGIHPEGLLHCPEVGLVSMDSHGRAPSTVGAVVPGLEIRLVGPRQAPVAAGRQGRLLASPVEFEGTGARKQGAGKRAGSPEDRAWIDTGHLAAQDPLGRLKLHGRDDDRVLVGGLPVSLSEVREILLAHPSVSDAEVTEPPPEAPSSLDGAALLLARAARRDGIPEEALLAHMGRLLSPHKIPARVDLVGARGPTARAETGRRRPRS
jgi:acyl-coenzyme A synthetase/AMP-(fatty) acid ligase